MAHYVNIPPKDIEAPVLSRDASELGLKPGYWPEQIVVNHALYFKRDGYILNDDDELGGYVYKARVKHGQVQLVVAND